VKHLGPCPVLLKQFLQSGIGAVTVRVFAVKVSAPELMDVVHFETWSSQANFNRLLDVARETFKENIADIYELGRELSEAHGLPLALVYQDSGFIFQLKKSEVEGELPAEFINVTEKKGRIVFSTLDLVRLYFVINNISDSSAHRCSSS
jgi:hypothetical protein